MISDRLVGMLLCPETRQRVTVADDALVEGINAEIHGGGLRNRGGEIVSEPLEGGLLREDGEYLYPVRQGVPVMLVEEAIQIAERSP